MIPNSMIPNRYVLRFRVINRVVSNLDCTLVVFTNGSRGAMIDRSLPY